MYTKKIDLNGTWSVSGQAPAPDGENGHVPRKTIKIKAEVPGHIHTDLLQEGLIQDPFWRNQAEHCQWVED